MKKIVVKCVHCKGEGYCRNGQDNKSCSFCQFAAGHEVATANRLVRCSICKGTGSVIKDKLG